MAKQKRAAKVSVDVDRATARQLKALFRTGLSGIDAVALA
jgi:hypothetical protein